MPQIKVTHAAVKGACAALAIALALPSFAQAPAVQTPIELRFDIARYRVEGNTLLSAPELEQIVAPFTGKGRDFGDVQRALEALERAYRERGYSAVQVFLPEQDLVKGEVLLRVIEARIKNVQVRGNKFFSEENVRASLPSLAAGRSPNANDVAKNLRLVNENPAKQTNVTLRAGAAEGEVDAVAEVRDDDPRKWFLTFDNTGTGATGYYRFGIGYQNANIGGSDDAMTLQYVTSDKPSQVGIYSVGYRKPFYTLGTSLDLVAGYSDVDAGTTQIPQGPLAFSGRGGVLGARYNWQLMRIAGYDHKLSVGLDHRMYRNSCSVGALGSAACGTAAATFSITPLSLAYAGMWIRENAQMGFAASASTNLGWGGSRADETAIDSARFGAKVHYAVYRFGANYARALAGDWQVRARLDAQYANEPLVAPEQFGIGGAASVRGFLERERADDRGHSGSFELYTPELAPKLGWTRWNVRMLAFYDLGRISRVDAQPGEQVHEGIASAGLGLRMNQQKNLALRFDLAQILDPGGTRERNHFRFNLGAVWSF